MNLELLIRRLNLEPLEGEGGLWSPIYRDEASNAINFLMIAPDFSAWHRLKEPELWIHVDGAPIILYTIEAGSLQQHRLDRTTGDFTYRVPARSWFAAKPDSEWSLAICVLTPPFSGMELAERSELMREYPEIIDLPELFHE